MAVLPDPTPDVVTAAWRELTNLDSDYYDDLLDAGIGSEEDGRLWLWPWTERGQVQGSGKGSIVLSTPGSWTSANAYNTLRFPRFQVEVYADIDRDEVAGPYYRSAQKKAQDIWVVVDGFLHRPGHRDMAWGDANGRTRVVSSVRSSGEPDLTEVPDIDGVWRLLANYAMELG
jgi:hypothetical protein